MDRSISTSLRSIFLAHAVMCVIFGLALGVAPGRVLIWLRWVEPVVELPGSDVVYSGTVFVDPVITRALGAALLALAFLSFLGFRSTQWSEVANVVKFEFVFCVLAMIGLLLSLDIGVRAIRRFNWLEGFLLIIFGIAWGWAWWSHTRD